MQHQHMKCLEAIISNVLRLSPPSRHLLPAGITGTRHEWQKHWSTESRTNVINMTATLITCTYKPSRDFFSAIETRDEKQGWGRLEERKKSTTKKNSRRKCFSVSWFLWKFFLLLRLNSTALNEDVNATEERTELREKFIREAFFDVAAKRTFVRAAVGHRSRMRSGNIFVFPFIHAATQKGKNFSEWNDSFACCRSCRFGEFIVTGVKKHFGWSSKVFFISTLFIQQLRLLKGRQRESN